MMEMIDEADRNNDGKIDFEEFFRVMKKRGDNPLDDLDSDEDQLYFLLSYMSYIIFRYIYMVTLHNMYNAHKLLSDDAYELD